MAVPQARANEVLFTFAPAANTTNTNTLGALGSASTGNAFKDSGTGDNGGGIYSVNVLGYNCTSGSYCASVPNNQDTGTTALYAFSGGLGIASNNNASPSNYDYEIPRTSYIQVDFSTVIKALEAAGDTINSITVTVTNLNVGWNLFTSKNAGYLEGTGGTSVGSFTTTTPENITGIPFLTGSQTYFVGITAAVNCDVELSSISVNYTPGTATPEPATCALMGFALLGMGFAGKKLRRRS